MNSYIYNLSKIKIEKKLVKQLSQSFTPIQRIVPQNDLKKLSFY